jgi:hypothetical protein
MLLLQEAGTRIDMVVAKMPLRVWATCRDDDSGE